LTVRVLTGRVAASKVVVSFNVFDDPSKRSIRAAEGLLLLQQDGPGEAASIH
jgi:hypothetical protein